MPGCVPSIRCSRIYRSASIPVLPVIDTPRVIPSRARFSAAQSVGAKWSDARRDVRTRFIGLDVGHRHSHIEGREGSAKRGGGLALDDRKSGRHLGQDRFEGGKDSRGRLVQCLVRRHHVEVEIGRDLERIQHLIEHAAVLRRHADFHRVSIREVAEVADQRRELDGFRPGSEDEKDSSRQGALFPGFLHVSGASYVIYTCQLPSCVLSSAQRLCLCAGGSRRILMLT
jgi:hypothetical protein